MCSLLETYVTRPKFAPRPTALAAMPNRSFQASIFSLRLHVASSLAYSTNGESAIRGTGSWVVLLGIGRLQLKGLR